MGVSMRKEQSIVVSECYTTYQRNRIVRLEEVAETVVVCDGLRKKVPKEIGEDLMVVVKRAATGQEVSFTVTAQVLWGMWLVRRSLYEDLVNANCQKIADLILQKSEEMRTKLQLAYERD